MILQKEISLFNSLGGDILPGGDFNSRIGNKYKDFIISDSNNFLPINSYMIQTDTHTFRSLQDRKSNTNSRHLADLLCMVNNLKILNGRKIGDLTEKYTYHQYNGSSVVDYVIAGTNIYKKINYFKFFH